MDLVSTLLDFLPKVSLNTQLDSDVSKHFSGTNLTLLVVSSRIPSPTSPAWNEGHQGGVATMLSSVKDVFNPVWLTIGNDGILLRADSDSKLLHKISHKSLMTHFMVSNEVLWPLFHNLSSSFFKNIDKAKWSQYLLVNRKVADAITATRGRSPVLINDYHFAMAPQFLNKEHQHSTVFFFHSSFPSFESISRLPWARELVQSISSCGAIGFQTSDDLYRFKSCQYEYHISESANHTLFVCPSTVDFARWEQKANTLDKRYLQNRLQTLLHTDRILLAIDRIDPVKGIDLKLNAFELVLQKKSSKFDISLVQIAVPSRDKLALYRRERQKIEEQVASINSKYGNRVILIKTLLSQEALATLYQACDGLVVSSRMEGMNLVAQEFIACRQTEPESSLLSENTGLAHRIPQLETFNPYDIESFAFRMSRIGETQIPYEHWNSGVEILRKNSPLEWVKKIVGALTS